MPVLDHAAVRALFPHTAAQTYLNHAATGVYSTRVVDALEADIADRHGRAVDNFAQVLPQTEAALDRLARSLGTVRDRVEFTANTTEALSVLAEGLDWQPGDRIALPACEFPANVYPFLHLERKGVGVDFIPHRDGTFSLDDVAAVLTPRTRLVTVSWVQFLSGFRVDVAALADLVHAHGALLAVDAIQGHGVLQLDAVRSGVDFLAGGAQKWWMGPQGIGYLYLTEAVQERITPRAGWLNVPVKWDDFFAYDLRFHPDARRFRLGTLNHMGALGFGAALKQVEDFGPDAIEAHVLGLSRRLRENLDRLGLACYGSDDEAHASGIVTFRHPRPDALVEALASERITVSARNRLVRVSPTWTNTDDDLARMLDAVQRFG
ncbi:MAG: aminotransferase class V-fold PLP-dependent enzyme [Bacteroidetes bacterium]|nr:aminotransferase class V-fold PLP-dependent enzyme [Bacteroidota bacterium]